MIIIVLIIITLVMFLMIKNNEKYNSVSCLNRCMPYGARHDDNYAKCYAACKNNYY